MALVTPAGDKLVAPLNAPGPQQLAVGIQPGPQSPIILAQYVIVSGNSDGVFVYALGTKPGSGNAPVEWMTAGVRDPYGNNLPAAGVGSQNNADTAWCSLTGGNVLVGTAGTGPTFAGTLSSSGPGQDSLTSGLQSVADTAATIQLLSEAAAGGSAALVRILNQLLVQQGVTFQSTMNVSGAAVLSSTLGVTGNTTVGGTLGVTGAVTATGGTAASPTVVTTDTWHNVAAASGFTVDTVQRYKLNPDNSVRIQFSLASTNTAGTYTLFTLPSGYIPVNQYDSVAVGIFNTTATFSAALLNCRFRVTTGGAVEIVNLPGTAINNVSGCFDVPLD